MERSRFSEEQIVKILKGAEGRMPLAELCREHGFSRATFTVADRAPGGECPAGTDACITEHVTITDNTIVDAVSSGIFFGSDGDIFDHPDMVLRDINVSRNTITGFFKTGIQGSLPASTADVHIEGNWLVSTRPRSVVGNFTGIFLKRGDVPGVPVTNAVVKRNTVTVSGEHASLDRAIFLSGDAVDVRMSGNVVRCEDCEKLERGIHLTNGLQEDITIEENVVERAGLAVQIQSSLVRAEIIRNRFSHSSAGAQVDIVPAGGSVEARIAENDILDGAGYGILCRGDGMFVLTGLETNFFSGNALGLLHGCP